MFAPIVQFQQVVKRFGDGPIVLDHLNFTANAGAFVSLIGPSGCGKSTFLRLIAALSPITSGQLTVAGGTPESAATELAFVFQEPTLLPWLTVAANVELAHRLRHETVAQRRSSRDRALALVGLQTHASFYPRQLSGGQKMRTSLARALTLSPNILLLDEPFGALDEMTREHLNEELLTIRQQQAWTAFFVTHSVSEAVFLSDRIVIMAPNPGRIVEEVRIDLPQPRTAETRLTRGYQDYVGQVSRQLRAAGNGV